LLVSIGAGFIGVVLGLVGNSPTPLLPLFGLVTAMFPLMWLSFRRKSRFKKFAKQLPDAMELMGRALRSGHSLASGLHLVCDEMPAPISQVFRAAYETQNLGVPVEQALKDSLKKMPNLDYKFFVTAVAIQRQTGGDLAEILDKISEVIRERFKILGTVQALTGEGRLSGAVLMAMPIAIFFAVYYLNPGYVMVLFTTDLGKKMIAVGIVMQILGAVAIKKIIDIKV
jgi:tight adherence protein B